MSENDAAFHRSDLASAKRIVVKVGSSLLTSLEAGLAREEIGQYCREIAVLMTAGKEIIMVSSGSIAEGCKDSAGPVARMKYTGFRPQLLSGRSV